MVAASTGRLQDLKIENTKIPRRSPGPPLANELESPKADNYFT